jgi:hypothetical protein
MSIRLPTLNSQWGIPTLAAGEALLILLAIARGADPDRIASYATTLISLTILLVLTIFHREALDAQSRLHREAQDAQSRLHSEALDAQSRLHREVMGEQANMRRLQTRPQVLVYFVRKPNLETDREKLVLVIKHFGGGPALDVQFAFDPPLVNSEGVTFVDDPPFSTGIAVMAPKFRREIEFDDYYQFQNRAGVTRIIGGVIGAAIDETRLDFEATVTLRDPIGDDQRYKTSYKLDLRDIMPYTMDFPAEAEPQPEA